MSVFRISSRRVKYLLLGHCRDVSQMAKNKTNVKEAMAEANVAGASGSTSKSSLYVVTRSGQGGVLALVQPALDFDTILKDTVRLEELLRNRNVDINVHKLKKGWHRLKDLKKKIKKLEVERENVVEKMKVYRNDVNKVKPDEKASSLMEKGKTLRKEIKGLKELACDVEEDVIVPAFKIMPNILHKDTPIDYRKVIYEQGSKPEFSFIPKSHTEIGKKGEEILFSDVSPGAYYLKGKAAEYELEIQHIFSEHLLQENFRPFSNPDFAKPLIVEACGMDPFTNEDVLGVQSKEESTAKETLTGLYVTGSASLSAFCAYHTRAVVSSPCVWPLCYFAIGRHYKPFKASGGPHDLLNVVQSSRIHFFIATENEEAKGMVEYESALQILIKMYTRLGLHFRIINIPAKQLHKTEMLRSSVQVWLPSGQKYTEVGYVAICGDYISRRLLCQYQDDERKNYLYMIHGVVVDIPRILACVIENNQTEDGEWTPSRV